MTYTVEQIGARAKQRNPSLAKFSDKEVGERLVKRNPNLAALLAPSTPKSAIIGVSTPDTAPSTPKTKPAQVITAPQTVVPYSSLPEIPRSTASFFPRAVADVFTGATQKLGGYLGNLAASTGGNTDVHGNRVESPQETINRSAIEEATANFELSKRLRGASPEEQARIKALIGSGSQVQTADKSIPLPSNRQFVGATIGTGLEALSGGLVTGAGAAGAAQTVGKAALKGGLTGASYGLAGGVSSALMDDKDNKEVLKRGALGAVVGGVAGASLGALTQQAAQDKILRETRNVSLKEGKAFNRIMAPPNAASEKAKAGGSNMATVLKEKGRGIGTVVKEAPYRLETAAKTARETQEALSKEPEAVRKAVSNGVSLREARLIETATPDEKKLFQVIADDFKTFASGGEKDPRLAAGEALRSRIAEAENLRRQYGNALGDAAESLKGTPLRAKFAVLDRLKSTPGLERVRIDNKGNLDFSRTILKSDASSADRNAINEMWRAMNGEDAFGLHQLRQEIFEVLGGRKRANVVLTDTQERALEAIREGLADSISEVSNDYKMINKAYAKVVSPLKLLRKAFMGLEGASGDIMDENGAVLLKRLTGDSAAGLKLATSLEKLDKELAFAGHLSGVNLKRVQQFVAAISGYYDTIKPTGFEGSISSGVSKGIRGALGRAFDYATDAVSATPEVRLRAFLDLLKK